MKKFVALLLALIMVLSMVACTAKEKEPEIQEVTYFCTIGAYLDVLTAEINKWNEGAGKEKGVKIVIESNINDGSSAIELQMQAGNHWDLMDGGSNQEWILQGWVQDLSKIEDAELQQMIKDYEPYMVPGLSWDSGILTSLPLEVVPLKMAVNVDLFEKSGLEFPETWDDVVACAQKITEDNPGTAWGYGGTTWSAYYRRLTMKASASSIETPWFDPNTGKYSFSQYEVPVNAIKTMYENEWILGMDDLAIDPIRAEFAAGKVGMFPAPAYDWAVYTNQFPAECNFTFIDMPTIGAEEEFQGVYLDRVGCSIDKVNYEAASDAKKQAIVEAFKFLNSDELNSTIYANGGMIPYKPEIIANTEMVITKNVEQWEAISDLTNYTSMWLYADGILPLEGDNYNVVFNAYVHGEGEWADIVADLEERYNAAWEAAVADPDVNTDQYLYEYSHDLG